LHWHVLSRFATLQAHCSVYRSSILVLSDDDVLGRIAGEGGCVDQPCLFLHFCGLSSKFIRVFFIVEVIAQARKSDCVSCDRCCRVRVSGPGVERSFNGPTEA
jgi:hypothetical protein